VSDPADLHRRLVDDLRGRGLLPAARLEAAFRAVPRHHFLPGHDLAEVYADQAILTHRSPEGFGTSSSSQPTIMALMLTQLDVQPGQRILEIGAGTGYNAALLAQLAGPEGRVTSVELDAQVAEEARVHLAAAGVRGVEVIAGDGGLGWARGAPYDRLIVTCGPADLPPAWWEQLRPGGRLVVPLTLAPGVARACAFDLVDGVLVSRSSEPCGFMPLRGEYAGEPNGGAVLADGVHLALVPDPGADSSVVRGWFERQPRVERLPLTHQDRELWESDVRLRVSTGEASAAVLHVTGRAARDRRWPLLTGQGSGPGSWGASFGTASREGVALLGWTRTIPKRLAVFAYGPDPEPQRRLVGLVQAWAEAGGPNAGELRVRAYPAGVEPSLGAGERAVRRRSCTLVIGFGGANPARRPPP
jgi:protein-L-isoaspartate(D-aspartate) O-methyltransferase